MEGLKGRGQRITLAAKGGDGTGRALLIDESYNANPASMKATLAQLGVTHAKRRIAVLGAMKELGEHGAAYHAALMGPIAASGVDYVVLVGGEMQVLADEMGKDAASALGKGTRFAHCETAAEAIKLLNAHGLAGGDAVLVKGSNSVGLGAVVAALAQNKE